MLPKSAASKQADNKPTAGSPQAAREAFFTRVVHEHAAFLYRVAASVLRHPQDAEDAVQDALLKLYRGESWQDIADERAFLARVVWRTALDLKAARVTPAEEQAEYRLHDTRATPEGAAVAGDERGLLQAWIDELAPALREPLVLSALEEMNSRKIGAVMGLPEGTVRTRLMRARAQLRARWEAQQRSEQQRTGRNNVANETPNEMPDEMPNEMQGAAIS